MLPRLIFSLALLGVTTSVWAFDLQDAWDAALGYDASHAAASHQRLAAQEQATQARAPLLPQIGVSANYQRNLPIDPNTDAYNQYGYSVQANQTLFDAGKWANYQQGKIAAQSADVQFDLSEQQLLLRVSQAYFDVLTAHDQIATAQASKVLYQRQLEQAKTMFDVGAATIVDTHEAQAGLDNAQVQWLTATQQLQLAQDTLQHLTGLNPSDIQTLNANEVSHIVPEYTLSQWQEQAQKHSSELTAKSLLVDQAKAAVQKTRAERYPKIELQAAYQDQRQDAHAATMNQAMHNRGASLGVNLNLPLYAGGGINSQIRQAEFELLQRQDEWLAAKRDVDLQVKQQFLNVQSGLAQIKALEQLVLTNRKKLDSTQLGQQVGVRSNLEVVMAQAALADSEQQLASARYQYLQAQLALSQVAGQLQSGNTLARINQAIHAQTLRKHP